MATSELPYTLPDANGLIHFPRSDGDAERLPGGSSGPRPEASPFVPVGLESKRSLNWRKFVGQAVAKQLMGLDGNYVLAEFPQHYRLYAQTRKGNEKHTDTYLFGSKLARFRSPQEFVPHAIFLLSDPSLDPKNCVCKYCIPGRRQSDINSHLGLKSKTQTTHARTTTLRGVPQAGVREATPADFKFPKEPKQIMNPQRVNDLRSPRRAGVPRLGEIVWCSIRPSIMGELPLQEIQFWPCIIHTHNVDTYVMSHEQQGGATENGEHPQQMESWTVDVLGTSQKAVIMPEDILPFLAYFPPLSILSQFDLFTPSSTLATISNFTPFPLLASSLPDPGTPPRTFEHAWPAYAIAVKTAAHLSTFWTLTDPYTHPVPPANIGDPSSLSASTGNRGTKHTRFQGVFWGAERIWEGDVVRLDVQFLSNPNVSESPLISTIGDSTDYRVQLLRNMTPEAPYFGLVMKVHAFHYVRFVPPEGGEVMKQCWMAGMVYEAAKGPDDAADGTQALPPRTIPSRSTDSEEEREVAVAMATMTESPVRSARSEVTPTPQNPNPESSPFKSNGGTPTLQNPGSSPTNASTPSRRRHPVLSAPPLVNSTTSDSSEDDDPLPAAPVGHVFRPLLPPSQHLYVNIQQLAGRYYPELMLSSLLHASWTGQKNGRGLEPALSLNGYLVATAGRAACEAYVKDRRDGIVKAERVAKEAWYSKWGGKIDSKLAAAGGEGGSGVAADRDGDVDMDAV